MKIETIKTKKKGTQMKYKKVRTELDIKADYVIYDRANDHVIQWESNGDMVIFGDKAEAEEDCRGNEEVIPCNRLPLHHQEILKQQIAKQRSNK